MTLVVPQYPNPYSVNPATNAIGWISFLALDFSKPVPSGRVVVNVNTDADSAEAYLPPLGQHPFKLGQVLVPEVPEIPAIPAIPGDPGDPEADPPIPPTDPVDEVPGVPGVPAVLFPNFMELMADPDFATAFNVIRDKLYQAILMSPEFENSIVI